MFHLCEHLISEVKTSHLCEHWVSEEMSYLYKLWISEIHGIKELLWLAIVFVFLQYKVLLYYTKEKPIAFAKISPSFFFVVSK